MNGADRRCIRRKLMRRWAVQCGRWGWSRKPQYRRALAVIHSHFAEFRNLICARYVSRSSCRISECCLELTKAHGVLLLRRREGRAARSGWRFRRVAVHVVDTRHQVIEWNAAICCRRGRGRGTRHNSAHHS